MMTADMLWRAMLIVGNHLWQSTVVAAVAWLLCRTILASSHPRVRCMVWLTVTVKFMVPFSLLIVLGHRLAPSSVISPAQSHRILEFVSNSNTAIASGPFQVVATRSVTTPESSALVPAALVAMWLVGVIVVMTTWVRAAHRIRRATVDSVRIGAFQGLPLVRSGSMRDQRIEPGLVGIWRPRILIPAGLEQELTDAQMQSLLLHEWHHARRHDNLSALALMAVEAAFWCYPLVWWVGRQVLEERERACDQDVLEQSERVDYVEGILKVCKWYSTLEVPCVSGITGRDLRVRVESVLRSAPPAPLSMMTRGLLGTSLITMILAPVVVGSLTGRAVFAQATNSFLGMATSANAHFDVATVKANMSDQQGGRLGPPGRGAITIVNLPLRGIIIQSFRTQRWMVFGGPNWINDERFDIVGKGSNPTATNPEVWEMMRSLLIERFHLKYHIEDREMAVLALTVAKGGPKLVAGEQGRCAQEIKEGRNCGDILVPRFGTGIYNMPIGALVTGMAGRAGRPVIDRTGLAGKYDITLSWMPEAMTHEEWESLPKEVRPEEMSIFEAVERQAGLKLEPSRAVLPVLVIDSVEHPTDN